MKIYSKVRNTNLEESNINERRIKVDEFKHEDFESETILILGLRSWIFQICHPSRHSCIDSRKNHDDYQVKKSSRGGSKNLRVSLEEKTTPSIKYWDEGNSIDDRAHYCSENHADLY